MSEFLRRRFVRIVVAPVAFALLITSFQVLRQPHNQTPIFDDFYYLFIARDLKLAGVFSDGLFRDAKNYVIAPDVREERTDVKPGRFFAPAYPLFLHLVQSLDPGLARSIRCHSLHKEEEPQPCPNNFGWLIAIQVLLAALAAYCAYVIALEISASEQIAWMTMTMLLATGELGFYARTYLSENLSSPSFFAFLAFAVLAASRRQGRWFLAAGMSLGLATLTRPSYLYLLEAIAVGLLALPLLSQLLKREALLGCNVKKGVLFAGGGLLLLGPWLLRNKLEFGDFDLTHNYAGYTLVQRLAYNQMSWPEWASAFLVWLPDVGEGLGKLLLPPRLYERLGIFDPNTYYQIGWNSFRAATLAAAGSVDAHLNYLIRTYLVGDLFKHTMVTLPLAWRGMLAGKLVAFFGLVLAWPALRMLKAEGKLWLFAVLALPVLFMVGLHAFVSVSLDRYNLAMIIVFALLIATYVHQRFGDRA